MTHTHEANRDVTDKHEMPDDIGAVKNAIQSGNLYPFDHIADAYVDLFEVATEPNDALRERNVNWSERELPLDKLRRKKVFRRLVILAIYQKDIEWKLQKEELPDVDKGVLLRLYKEAIDEITGMYDYTAEEVQKQADVRREGSRYPFQLS